jgi:hypothetical protein
VYRAGAATHDDRYPVRGAVTAGLAAKGDDDIMAQTRRLIDEVLPLVAARWPKPSDAPAVLHLA